MSLNHNIRNVLRENGVSFRENGKSFILNCFRCGKQEKLYIRKSDGHFICFTCSDNYTGAITRVLSELLNIAPWDILNLLELESFNAPIYEVTEAESLIEHKIFPPSIVSWEHPLFRKGQNYLEGRGISLDMIKFFNVHYDYSLKRIIFPVLDDVGIVGWTDRIILPDDKLVFTDKFGNLRNIPKSLHNFDKGRYLLFNELWPEEIEHLIIAEGPISAMKAHLCGNAVATMGKKISGHQIELIKARRVKRLYLGFDPDAGAEIEKLVQLFYGRGTDLYLLPPSKGKADLGDCTPEEVYDIFRSASEKLTPSHIIVI